MYFKYPMNNWLPWSELFVKSPIISILKLFSVVNDNRIFFLSKFNLQCHNLPVFLKGGVIISIFFFQTDLKCRFFKVDNRLNLKNNTKNITLEFHRKFQQLYTFKLYDLPYRNNMSDNRLWAGPIFCPHPSRSKLPFWLELSNSTIKDFYQFLVWQSQSLTFICTW